MRRRQFIGLGAAACVWLRHPAALAATAIDDEVDVEALAGRWFAAKIDVEGAENGVLAGMTRLLSRASGVFQVEVLAANAAHFERLMAGHGYVPVARIDDDWFFLPKDAAAAADDLLSANPDLAGLFVVWDTPALAAATRLAERGATMPMATVDLGEAAAVALAQGESFCSIAAQQPFLQGIAAAQTAILCLLGRPVPAWIALPGIGVTRDNVVESFQTIWRQPAPREVLRIMGLSRGK